ncbi:hypothetical protein [Nostoc flagelliforme]|uniref:hypothetical protein n=1 Tax=Nostoc flagelliforme TaxID=1306274 RepID=UPI000C2CEDE8|nr:hypothetical protein [Nostoc flagelliforme]
MQSIKQLGKQLGFVVLIGSAMFSVSSASPLVKTRIAINTDLIIDPAELQRQFPGVTELNLFEIGGSIIQVHLEIDLVFEERLYMILLITFILGVTIKK